MLSFSSSQGSKIAKLISDSVFCLQGNTELILHFPSLFLVRTKIDVYEKTYRIFVTNITCLMLTTTPGPHTYVHDLGEVSQWYT